MKILSQIFLILIFATFAHGEIPTTRPATTKKATTRPTTLIKQTDCVTSQCHGEVKAYAIKHGPVVDNSCDSCHELQSAARHTYKILRTKAELCTFCHEFSVAAMPVKHKPASEGECLGCHDPHGGPSRALLREASVVELCGRCHDSVTKKLTFAHGPVATGQCDSCHTPHASRFPKLLDVVGTDMCLSCHIEYEQAVAGAKFKHKALEKGCEQCHSAHGSSQTMSLLKPANELCLSCHEKTAKQLEVATVKHNVVSKDRGCLNCHDSHASNVGKLLTEPSAVSCLKCHDKPVKSERGGATIAAVPEISKTEFYKHGEIRDGQCGSCHEVHGSTRPLLLAKDYSTALYRHFDVKDFELCFGCHDVKAIQEEKTEKLTAFRNGQLNLHYIHAVRGFLDKNCRACHVTHAGPNPRIVRTSLKYGNWLMPLRFQKTETGGSCTPGCHGQWAYDRLTPATRPTTLPATLPTPTLARAERDESQVVHWQAADVTGAMVIVPDESHPTALALLSADDLDRQRVIAPLKSAVPEKTPAQVVVVISGPKATEEAQKLVAEKALPWPIIADPQHGASEALGVRGWPVVMVLKPDGTEVIRVSGKADFLSAKLPIYLEYASGKISKTDLEKHLATHPVEEDESARKQSRELRLAKELIKQGKAQEALDLLSRKTGPPPPTHIAAACEALLALGKPDEALLKAGSLKDEALPTGVVQVLRAKCYIAMEEYKRALEILGEVDAKYPDQSEVHDLLGRAYELLGDTVNAARHLRISSDLNKKAAGAK